MTTFLKFSLTSSVSSTFGNPDPYRFLKEPQTNVI